MMSLRGETAEIRHTNRECTHRNRTITFSQAEAQHYGKDLIRISKPAVLNTIENKIANHDLFEILTLLPRKFADLLILASTNPGDLVFDPFAGVGSSLVTAKKLNRKFFGVEIEKQFCLLALKRLHLAEKEKSIQGYKNSVFWERNTLSINNIHRIKDNPRTRNGSLEK